MQHIKIMLSAILLTLSLQTLSAQLYENKGTDNKEDIYNHSETAPSNHYSWKTTESSDDLFDQKPSDIGESTVPVADGLLWIGVTALLCEYKRTKQKRK